MGAQVTRRLDPMSFALRTLALLVLALSLSLPAASAPADEAGDSPSMATGASEGRIAGRLRPHDEDWFAVAAQGPACVRVVASASNLMDVVLESARPGADLRSVTRLTRGGTSEGALLLPSGASLLVGVVGAPNPSGHVPARPGDYTLDVDVVPVSDVLGGGDAGSGADAPDSGLWARGACLAGSLRPDAGDAVDAFAARAAAGDVLTVAFEPVAGAPLVLDVLAPDGTVLASVPAGGVAMLEAPTDGVYTTRVAVASGASLPAGAVLTYLFGFGGGPPGSPCRPQCMAT